MPIGHIHSKCFHLIQPDLEQERKEGSKDLLRDRCGREMGRDRGKLISSNLTTLPGGR